MLVYGLGFVDGLYVVLVCLLFVMFCFWINVCVLGLAVFVMIGCYLMCYLIVFVLYCCILMFNC